MATVRELVTKFGFKIDDAPLKKMDAGIESLKTGVFAIGAAATAAAGTLFGLAKSTANAADAARKSAAAVGLSTETYQELAFAANLGGVSQEELSVGLMKLSRNAVEAASGNIALGESFKKMGVSVKDAGGKIKSSDVLLGEISDTFAKMPNGPEKTALAMDLFGKSGTKLIPTLNEGSAGISKLRQEAVDLGIVIGDDTAKQAEAMNDNISRLMAGLEGLKNTIGAALIPLINDVVLELSQWLKANGALIKQNLSKFVGGLIDFLKTFWSISKQVAGTVNNLVVAFGGWERAIRFAATAVGIFLGLKLVFAIGLITQGFIGMTAAIFTMGKAALIAQAKMLLIPLLIGAAIVALILIIEDIISYFRGGNSITGIVVESIKNALTEIGAFFSSIWGSIKDFGDSIVQKFTEVFDWVESIGKSIADTFSESLGDVMSMIKSVGSFLGKGLEIGARILGSNSEGIDNAVEAGKSIGGITPQTAPANKTMSNQNNIRARTEVNVNVQGLPPEAAERATTEAVQNGLETLFRETSRATEPQVEF